MRSVGDCTAFCIHSKLTFSVGHRSQLQYAGILLAGSWLLCQIAPWTVSLLTAAAVAHVWFNRPCSLSIVAFVMTPICSILAAIPGGLPSMIPAQHLVTLTVTYPYFHGSVVTARVCARWIQQQQSLCASLNAAVSPISADCSSLAWTAILNSCYG